MGGVIMHIALNVNVQVKDGRLVLTDREGKTVTFSKEQTVQKKVSMIALGELCGLPKHQLANGFGFKTRKSYYLTVALRACSSLCEPRKLWLTEPQVSARACRSSSL
jgi:hypothetical protein